MPNPPPQTNRATDTDRHVGAQIRERRVTIGYSQQQIADLIGITYQQAHKYERGINRISAGRLYEIAQVLGVPVGYFVSVTRAPPCWADHVAGIMVGDRLLVEAMSWPGLSVAFAM